MLIGGIWNASDGSDPTLATSVLGSSEAFYSGAGRQPHLAASRADGLAEWGPYRCVGDIRLAGRIELKRALAIDSEWEARCSDAELFLRAWAAWGVATLQRIEGEFAVAVWDGPRGELVLARDVLGQRPLHHARCGNALIFGSRPMPLALAIDRPVPDVHQLASFLAILPEQGEASFVTGVQRIPPGHALIVSPSGQRLLRYWDLESTPLRLSRADALVQVRGEIDRSVGDLPPAAVAAAQLSGGLDSSLVVESLARQRSARIVAITGGADAPDDNMGGRLIDEASVAAQTAAMLGIEHVVALAPSESPLTALERWLPTTQRPLLNPCNLGWIDATYAAACKIGSPFLLNGMSGNFTVSHEGLSRLPALARHGRFFRFAREMALYRNYAGASWLGVGAFGLGWAIPSPFYRLLAQWRGHGRESFERRSFLRTDHPAVAAARRDLRRLGLEPNPRLKPIENPGDVLTELRFNDPGLSNASLAARYGIASIDPLGSRRLIELCLRLRSEHFFHDGQPRQVARALLAGKVPDDVLREHRRGYQGSNWRRGAEGALDQLVAEVDLASRDGDSAGLFDLPAIRGMLTNWPTDGWNAEAQVQRYRRDLIRAVAALRWMRWVREEGRG